MPKTATKHSTPAGEVKARRDRVEKRVEGEGFRSLYEMCREKKVDYQLALRARREGLTPRSTLHTVEELKRLGIYEDILGAA